MLMARRVRNDKLNSFLLRSAIPKAPINTRTPACTRPSLLGPNNAPRATAFMIQMRIGSRIISDITVGLQVGHSQLSMLPLARPISIGTLSLGMDTVRIRTAQTTPSRNRNVSFRLAFLPLPITMLLVASPTGRTHRSGRTPNRRTLSARTAQGTPQ